MSAELRITEGCPACGQLLMFALPASIGPGDRVGVAVAVDPNAAQLARADPGDHPCPGDPEKPVSDAVPEDHAS